MSSLAAFRFQLVQFVSVYLAYPTEKDENMKKNISRLKDNQWTSFLTSCSSNKDSIHMCHAVDELQRWVAWLWKAPPAPNYILIYEQLVSSPTSFKLCSESVNHNQTIFCKIIFDFTLKSQNDDQVLTISGTINYFYCLRAKLFTVWFAFRTADKCFYCIIEKNRRLKCQI